MPPGSANPSSRAAMLTLSPKRSAPSTTTSPTLMPMRNSMRSAGGSPKRRRQSFNCPQIPGVGVVQGIDEDPDARKTGHSVLEKLQPFATNRVLEMGKSGQVGARSSQARHDPGAHRI